MSTFKEIFGHHHHEDKTKHKGPLKLIMLGGEGSGKTPFLQKLSMINTQQADGGGKFPIKELEVNGKKLKIELWDTLSLEKIGSIPDGYYAGADIAIGMYTRNYALSLLKLREEIEKLHSVSNPTEKPLILIVENFEAADLAMKEAAENVSSPEVSAMRARVQAPFISILLEKATPQFLEEVLIKFLKESMSGYTQGTQGPLPYIPMEK